MPIDRAATLRNAEKLLRQGKAGSGNRGVRPRRSLSDPLLSEPPSPSAKPAVRTGISQQGEVSPNPTEPQSPAGDFRTPPTIPHVRSANVEVDLSVALEDIQKPSQSTNTPARVGSPVDSTDIDPVFGHVHDEAEAIATEEEYKRGLALYNAGRIEECLPALQAATRAPRLRFATAWLIGRIYRERGMMAQAIEWLERAGEASARDQGHLLLCELADALESAGEMARALAICMELQADAGGYRDVAVRIRRVARVQARR